MIVVKILVENEFNVLYKTITFSCNATIQDFMRVKNAFGSIFGDDRHYDRGNSVQKFLEFAKENKLEISLVERDYLIDNYSNDVPEI